MKLTELIKAVLSTNDRKKLDKTEFALPPDRYPIPDEAHARNALARASQFGTPEEIATVRAAVHRRFPQIAMQSMMSDHKGMMSKGQVKRRIKSATITTIALCQRGMNGLPVVYKSGDADIAHFDALVKATDQDAGELLAVVYVPEENNWSDLEGDTAPRAALRKIAHDFNRDHRQLDISHDGKVLTKEQAFVAESFIVAKGDERFANWKDYDQNPVKLDDAWAVVIKLEDQALRKAYREGEFNGVSMFGPAVVETVSSKSVDEVTPNQKDDDMTAEQIAALAKAITDGVVTALKPTPEVPNPTPETAKAPAKPVFEGDPSNKEHRDSFLTKMRSYEVAQAVAGGKSADEVAELFKKLDEVEPTDAEAGIVKADTSETRELKRKLFKAQRRSNQSATDKDAPTSTETDISKEMQESIALGDTIAKMVNTKRGVAPAKA